MNQQLDTFSRLRTLLLYDTKCKTWLKGAVFADSALCFACCTFCYCQTRAFTLDRGMTNCYLKLINDNLSKKTRSYFECASKQSLGDQSTKV